MVYFCVNESVILIVEIALWGQTRNEDPVLAKCRIQGSVPWTMGDI